METSDRTSTEFFTIEHVKKELDETDTSLTLDYGEDCESSVTNTYGKIDKNACLNVKIENSDGISENLNSQKYYVKEEVDLDWDEKDNNYDENHDILSKKTMVVHEECSDPEDHKRIKVEETREEKDDPAILFTCPICSKQFQRNASLASHMRFCIKSQDVNKPASRYVGKMNLGLDRMITNYCAKCSKINPIRTHMSQVNECCNSVMLFKCSNCSQIFENLTTVRDHVKNECYSTIKYKCDICDYEGTKKNLTQHQQNVHVDNIVECPNCKIMLKNKRILNSHLLGCGKEPLKCRYCWYSCKKEVKLKLHIIEKHQNMKSQ